MATEKRQRQKEGHRLQQEELRRWERRRALRRRFTIYGGLVIAALVLLFLYSLVTDDDEAADESQEAATTSVPSTTALPAPTECPPRRGVDEPVRAFSEPPPDCLQPGVDYAAVLQTSEGEIRVDLDEGATPQTVNNFVVLARYGYYDDTPVFRTDPSIGIIQAGGQGGQSSPGYTIPDEGEGYTYEPGQIVMARTPEPDSAHGQFFLVANDAASTLDADGSYVVFGETDAAGLEVVRSILDLHEDQPDNPLGGGPSRPVTIDSVTIEQS